ncbi:putative signal peptide protein [Puccinia sorghi]|uniref:Putative signal peptide protein n=1 Tax=Puccinia sorghi TaxID=27349 RepID=A0A0L6U968_9BASI|nr:putative signal peptide protein [Puccinia sorghi]
MRPTPAGIRLSCMFLPAVLKLLRCTQSTDYTYIYTYIHTYYC